LGHSEELRIEHPPSAIPPPRRERSFDETGSSPSIARDFNRDARESTEDSREISAVVRAKGSIDVLPDDESRAPASSHLLTNSNHFKEESAPLSSHSRAETGHGKVRAGTSSANNINEFEDFALESADIFMDF
jgi:hypothetical protein